MPRPIIYPDFRMVETNINAAMHLLYRGDHWHVDCEYNRRGLNRPKAILNQNTSYPDIIIHKRNTKANLLVVETKSIHSTDHSDIHDKEKIKAYIEDPDYQYRFGLWICFFDELSNVVMNWFENRDGRRREVGRE
jgi:hypothetical protein